MIKQVHTAFLALFFLLLSPGDAAPAYSGKKTAEKAKKTTASLDPGPLIKQAEKLRLYQQPYWLILGHYQRQGGGYKSLIDDPAFFLSPHGRRDPRAELAATLRAFCRTLKADEKIADHPVARFPARFDWLVRKLGVPRKRFPIHSSPDFDRLMRQLQPQDAILVFPSAYMNSPASMFGHTLLNFNTHGHRNKLLAQSINYAAQGTDQNGLLFAVKGIFGGYHGYFSVLPYYQRVQEYSDLDQRDIWEYKLNLTPAEIRRMLRHLWELQNRGSRYYFFTENCSSNLLYLLDAARPAARLRQSFHAWVIPLDTIRAVRKANLVDSIAYRPSKATRIRHLQSLLNSRGRRLALTLAGGKLSPDSPAIQHLALANRRRTLELAVNYLQHDLSHHRMEKKDYLSRLLPILRVRSACGGKPPPRIPPPSRPDLGHASAAMSLGWIREEGEKSRLLLGWRPAYHSELDPEYGFTQGAAIEFLDIACQLDTEKPRIRLDHWRLLRILSLTPKDEFFRPVSWLVEAEIRPRLLSNQHRPLLFNLAYAFGSAWRLTRQFLGYGMLNTEVLTGGGLARSLAIGGGGRAGILFGDFHGWTGRLEARALGYVPGHTRHRVRVELGIAREWHRNLSLQLRLAHTRVPQAAESSAKLELVRFF